jgi:N-acyl-L-homoserine lactone synthetase
MNRPRMRVVYFRKDGNPELLDALFRFRRRLFVEALNWNLTVVDGKEIDQFDTDSTCYCALFADEKIVGGFRAIRTDEPYLVASIFPELAADRPFPSDRDCWEISRFGILSDSHRLLLARANYSAMFRFAHLHQAKALVALADLTYERYLSTLGIRTVRYGLPRVIGEDRHGNSLECVAGEIPIHGQSSFGFSSILSLAHQMEFSDETLVLGRRLIPA